MPRSKSVVLPLFALFAAGLSWGTTAIFVRVLGQKGFSSFELLVFRLVVVGAILLPGYIVWILFQRKLISETLLVHGFRDRVTYFVGVSMLCYYLGAIVAVQNLPLVMAVLLIGSSPLLAWLWPLVKERRGVKSQEKIQGIGVLVGILGLIGFALSKSVEMNSGFGVSTSGSPALGYLSGILSSVVTVFNSRILKSRGDQAPSPMAISLVTAGFATTLLPFLFLQDDSHDLAAMVRENFELLIGFGVIATLIPGLAQTVASIKLSPVLSSTVTIQLQLWTAVFGWIILKERLTGVQIAAGAFVLFGTLICLLGTEVGARWSNRLK